MQQTAMSRRRLLGTALATLGVFSVTWRQGAQAAPAEIKLPDNSAAAAQCVDAYMEDIRWGNIFQLYQSSTR
jgi:hypothetical protein